MSFLASASASNVTGGPSSSSSSAQAADFGGASSYMRAAILQEFGSEDKLQYVKTRPRPSCGPHDVLIRVKACAVGHLDAQARTGLHQKFVSPPCVPGYEFSGVVAARGSDVTTVDVGDEVVAVCPLDNVHGGLAEYSVQRAYNVVKKPDLVSHEEAAACLLSGLSAYTAFHYQLHVKPGDIVLVCSGRYCVDTVAVQLAGLLGAKVIVTASTTEQINMFGDCGNHVVRVIDLATENVLDVVRKETGGMGVACVLDLQDVHPPAAPVAAADELKSINNRHAAARPTPGVSNEEKAAVVGKSEIIQCLSVHSRWCTSDATMQLDPPDSQQLFLRSATLSFLFPQAWLMAPLQQGKFFHIITDLLEKLAKGQLKAVFRAHDYTIDRVRQAHRDVVKPATGKAIVKL